MQCKERVYSARGSTPAIGGEGVCCEEKIRNIKNVTSTVQREKECNTRRVASAVPGKVCAVRGERVLPEGLHLQQENKVCGLRRTPAVSGMSHLQYWERKYAVPGGSRL